LSTKPILVFLGTVLSYVLFPKEAFVGYSIILLFTVILDIITKYYSISVKNGGLVNAFQNGHLSSSKFWFGTRRKIISYLVIMSLLGLSMRFGVLETITTFTSTLIYFLLFLRESQSILENLIEAEHSDLIFFLNLIKRKEKEVEKQLLDGEEQKES
jgi:phage-related holin